MQYGACGGQERRRKHINEKTELCEFGFFCLRKPPLAGQGLAPAENAYRCVCGDCVVFLQNSKGTGSFFMLLNIICVKTYFIKRGLDFMNSKLENILKGFNSNQLKEINDFLNSAQGRSIKNKLNSADKERLMREFNKLDSEKVKKQMQGLNPDEIMKIIKNL